MLDFFLLDVNPEIATADRLIALEEGRKVINDGFNLIIPHGLQGNNGVNI